MPMMIAAIGPTYPDAGVIATSPATAPEGSTYCGRSARMTP